MPRRTALLLHPTALPGGHGIGDLGPSASALIDWLASAGFSAWQVLPLGVPGPLGCPYSSPASRLGDPLLISLDRLVEQGLLDSSDLPSTEGPTVTIDFAEVERAKRPLLLRAARQLLASPGHPLSAGLEAFRASTDQLAEMSLFRALHRAYDGQSWWTWPDELRWRDPLRLARERGERAEAVALEEVLAFFFAEQWSSLRSQAALRGLQVIGDLPIYVAADSADVWARPELFELTAEGRPARVAGVPPDAFAPRGQRWGNPLYAWDRHREEGYAWWCSRVRRACEDVDLLRLDHFRGFSSYYAIEGDSVDATDGEWVPGPGRALFAAIEEQVGAVPLIAEDLGFVDGDVVELRRACGLPSMRVLQFGLEGGSDNPHVPENIPVHAVAYTGTHDNPTSRGWWDTASGEQRQAALALLGGSGDDFVERLILAALGSAAEWAVLPAQDLLELGNEARTNVPGTVEGNWAWRLTAGQLESGLAERVAAWIRNSDREGLTGVAG